MVEQLGQLALTLAQLVEVGIGLAKGIVHLVILLEGVHDRLHSLLHHLFHRLGVVQFRLLFQIAHAVAGREDHLALIVLVDSGDNLQQARLTRTVETDDAYLSTIEEREINVFQYLAAGRDKLPHAYHRENDFFVVCHIVDTLMLIC